MRGALKVLGAVAILAVLAPSAWAKAYLYWTDPDGGAIGRAAYDGSGADASFITGTTDLIGIAVNSKYIYWSTTVHKIARANIDGTGVSASFISASGGPYGVAVNSTHIFWVDAGGVISRAKLDGTNVIHLFISGLTVPYGIAVWNDYIYFTTFDTIGRAKINGTSVNTSFITGLNRPEDVVVYGNYIYWTDRDNGAIGRANLDGTGVNQSFITGATGPYGIAVGGGYLFWANFDSCCGTTIGRADLAGTNVNQSFLSGGTPDGLATTYDIPPQTTITVKPASGTHSTTATFEFKSNKAGTFECSLDGSAFASCTTPKTYSGLTTGGSHTFKVRARDLAGKNDPTPAAWTWKIV